MSNDSPHRKTASGVLPRARAAEDRDDERQRREDAAVRDIDERLARGQLTPEEADREILELALARFAFLPPEAVDELRQIGAELLEEPELVETRELAPGSPKGREP